MHSCKTLFIHIFYNFYFLFNKHEREPRGGCFASDYVTSSRYTNAPHTFWVLLWKVLYTNCAMQRCVFALVPILYLSLPLSRRSAPNFVPLGVSFSFLLLVAPRNSLYVFLLQFPNNDSLTFFISTSMRYHTKRNGIICSARISSTHFVLYYYRLSSWPDYKTATAQQTD